MKCIALLLALVASAASAEKAADFAFGIPLSLEGERAFYRVELPGAVYSGSARADAGDLRVFNGDDAMVPYSYVPRPAPSREKRSPQPLPMFPLFAERGADPSGLSLSVTRNAAGTIVSVATQDTVGASEQKLTGYLVDATALTQSLSALALEWPTPLQGVASRVRVEASEDLASWRMLAPDAPLLDLSYAGRRLLHNRVELTANKPKYLRLSWPAGAVPALSAVLAEFGESIQESPRRWSEATGVPVADRENEYEFDLGAVFPVDRVAIDLPEVNAVVPGELFGRATREQPWRPVATLVAYRLRQEGGEASAAPTPVFGSGLRYWLLRIDPKSGGFGRGQPRLRAGWAPQEIVFAARGAGPFTIAYGNPSAPSSALPITTLVPGYGSNPADPLAAAGIARPEASTPLGGPARLRPAHDLRRASLWGVLVLGVVVLAWMAWRLSKQMQPAQGAQGATASRPPDGNAG
jgi:hypothetical protein